MFAPISGNSEIVRAATGTAPVGPGGGIIGITGITSITVIRVLIPFFILFMGGF